MDQEAMKVLEGIVEPVILSKFEIDHIKKMVVDVVGIMLRTNIQINREIIEAAPLLKIISRTGAGVDNVDLTTASERGILVCNAPGINSISVAEHVLAFMLAIAKQLAIIDKAVRQGNWKIRYTSQAGDLEGKVLGLVGLGQIGSLLAEKARLAFHMKISAYDPYVKQVEHINLTSNLEDLFCQSDFVSIHVPYTEETHHLVNERLLNLMKPGSYLVNTSRGAVVDEKALFKVLEKSLIAGAALDVFEDEPPSLDNPILKLDNVIVTAHTAGLNRDCERKLAIQAAKAIVDYIQGKELEYIYNKKELKL